MYGTLPSETRVPESPVHSNLGSGFAGAGVGEACWTGEGVEEAACRVGVAANVGAGLAWRPGGGVGVGTVGTGVGWRQPLTNSAASTSAASPAGIEKSFSALTAKGWRSASI
jgi:hypothetical protein